MPGSGERHVPSFCSVKKAIMCPQTPDSSDHSRLHGGRLLSEGGGAGPRWLPKRGDGNALPVFPFTLNSEAF